MSGLKILVPKGWAVVGPAVSSEDGMDLVGASDADVVLDQRLEEAPCPSGVIEDQGARDLHLAHRELPEVGRLPVLVGERCGDHPGPAVEEVLDLTGPEAITDGLEGNGVFARGETVGQLAEGDALMTGLLLGPLVSVAPDLRRVVGIGPGRSAALSNSLFPRPAPPSE